MNHPPFVSLRHLNNVSALSKQETIISMYITNGTWLECNFVSSLKSRICIPRHVCGLSVFLIHSLDVFWIRFPGDLIQIQIGKNSLTRTTLRQHFWLWAFRIVAKKAKSLVTYYQLFFFRERYNRDLNRRPNTSLTRHSQNLSTSGPFTPSISIKAAMMLAILFSSKNNGVTPEWGCNSFSNDSIVFNENKITSSITELSQHWCWCLV